MVRVPVYCLTLIAAFVLSMPPAALGDPLFRYSYNFGVGSVASPRVADLNGDGNIDILTANNGLEVLLGAGDGSFPSNHTYFVGTGISFLALGDFNADGKVDVAVIDTVGVQVLLGNGDGTFQSPQTVGPGSGEVAVGDVNGDGKLDIVAPSGNSIGAWLGNGNGTFQAGKFSAGGFFGHIALADVNLDHKLDVFVTNTAGVGFMPGNGDGTFQSPQTIDAEVPISIGTADMNHDSKPGLITLGSVVKEYLGNGDGTFQAPTSYSTGGLYPVSMLVADANGDGWADVLIAECTNVQNMCFDQRSQNQYGPSEVGVLINFASGGLSTATLFNTGGRNRSTVALGDVNNDGRVDLIGGALCSGGRGCDFRNNFGISLATGRYPVTETFTTSPNPSQQGQAITFTVTITSPIRPLIPTGTIRFKSGKVVLANVALVNGVATFTTSSLPVGTTKIIAFYLPGRFWYKAQQAITQVVNP